MKRVTFEYKCRRCDAIDTPVSCGKELAESELLNLIYDDTSMRQAMSPTLLKLHPCKDGGCGIADLQGCSPNE